MDDLLSYARQRYHDIAAPLHRISLPRLFHLRLQQCSHRIYPLHAAKNCGRSLPATRLHLDGLPVKIGNLTPPTLLQTAARNANRFGEIGSLYVEHQDLLDLYSSLVDRVRKGPRNDTANASHLADCGRIDFDHRHG